MDSFLETLGFIALIVFCWFVFDPESLGKALDYVSMEKAND